MPAQKTLTSSLASFSSTGSAHFCFYHQQRDLEQGLPDIVQSFPVQLQFSATYSYIWHDTAQ